jgi:hypothetical protein
MTAARDRIASTLHHAATDNIIPLETASNTSTASTLPPISHQPERAEALPTTTRLSTPRETNPVQSAAFLGAALAALVAVLITYLWFSR